MTDSVFQVPEHLDDIWEASLPAAKCLPCGRIIPRRQHRIMLRASWRNASETLCPECWKTVCNWASRFALEQGLLDL
jgi:hypothetical protein